MLADQRPTQIHTRIHQPWIAPTFEGNHAPGRNGPQPIGIGRENLPAPAIAVVQTPQRSELCCPIATAARRTLAERRFHGLAHGVSPTKCQRSLRRTRVRLRHPPSATRRRLGGNRLRNQPPTRARQAFRIQPQCRMARTAFWRCHTDKPRALTRVGRHGPSHRLHRPPTMLSLGIIANPHRQK